MAVVLFSKDVELHASAVMVVLDTYPRMIIEIIGNQWPPKQVFKLTQNEKNQWFMRKITPLQRQMILKLDVSGYINLDVSCIYKLIRHFNLLPVPNQGWGNKPSVHDTKEGDDVERMKIYRNDILHRPRGGLSEQEGKHFFQESYDMAKRLDISIGSPMNGFESKIKDIKCFSVDRQKYMEALEKCAEYQAQLQETRDTPSIDLYYGTDIMIKLGSTDNKNTSGESQCSIYIRDQNLDVNAVIQKLDHIKKTLEKGSYNDIKLDGAESGSLILHISIPNRCFVTKETLVDSLQSFLHQFFLTTGFQCKTGLQIVLAESDRYTTDLPSKMFGPNRVFVHKDWFYKLDLECDNIYVDCIVDRRLEMQYGYLKSVYGRKNYNDCFYKPDLRWYNIDIDCITSKRQREVYGILKSVYGRKNYSDNEETKTKAKKPSFYIMDLSEFEAIYFLKDEKKRKKREDKYLNSFLIIASEKKRPCLCRFLLHMFRNLTMYRNVHKAFTIAFENDDIQTARVLSWCITKSFYKYNREKLSNAINIYPGLRCICKEKSLIECCFSSKSRRNFVIVVIQQEKDPQLPNKYLDLDIEYVSPNASSRSEGNTILEYLTRMKKDSFSFKACISNQKAQTLFLNHNNLGLICPSFGRSKFFSSEHHTISDERCIQFHCAKKGIIPIGNEHFPNIINGCPTDVIEAQPVLLSNIRIGDKVGTETSAGRLGGFVKYLDVDCFLTCAHVMFDLKTLLEPSSNFARLKGAKAYLYTQQGPVECGRVIWRSFNHDDTSRTSVDAALVQLTNASVNPNDIIAGFPSPRTYSDLGLSTFLLNDMCLDHAEFCITTQTVDTVSTGAMTKLDQSITIRRQSDVDVQFSNTGPTAASVNANVYHPLWIYTPAHLQLPSGYLTDRRIFRMYNQMAVHLPLVQGDSGTCIYIVNHPGNKNGCIGMAIAFCGGLTIVTPLKEIFKRMNIS